jgi:hypothetical protein
MDRLEPIAPQIWAARSEVRLPGAITLPSRMTVVRLPSGDLWLYSPIRPDENLMAEVRRLGPIKHLVSPNTFHHLHIAGWAARYPDAQLYLAPGLDEKRPDLKGALLGPEAPSGWEGALETLLIAGMPSFNEVVVFHAASRTLIVSDLLFHIRKPANFMSALTFRILGTYKRLGPSRLFRRAIRDKAAFDASLDRMFAWDFDTLVMSHGEPIGPRARDAAAAVLR